MTRFPIPFVLLSCCCVTTAPIPPIDTPKAAVVLTSYKLPNTVDLGEIDDEELLVPAARFKKLAERGEKEITLRINSPGGSIFAGHRWGRNMEDLKKRHGLKVTCVVDGMAASMAAVILESPLCDTRLATTRSIILFHNGSSGTRGTAEDLKQAAIFLEALNQAMAHAVSNRLGLTLEDYRAKIAGVDWVMAAVVAKYDGVIDGFADPTEIAPPEVSL